MKKEIGIHFISVVIVFVLFSFINNFLSVSYWPFWLGGIIGTILPDVDHLIYIYFLRPNELTSQRINYLMGKRAILESLQILYMTRTERKKLIFHSAYFQIIFAILAFWVITTSSGLLGKGLVLAFLIHLLVDQIIDIKNTKTLENWFNQILPQGNTLNRNQVALYLMVNLALVLFFGILL